MDRLGPGVVELGRGFFRPGRDQSPAHQLADAAGVRFPADDRDLAGRRDVEARIEVGATEELEVLDQLSGCGR